jgi:CubicO group peptidase (beta-lactamase class C family)
MNVFRIKILIMMFCVCLPSASKAEDKPEKDSIGSSVQAFVDDHALAGAVMLVANKDKVLAVESVGFADIAATKSMRNDALFWIASQSKSMTAAAVMMLVDEKKIALDDPVEKYLPEFKGQMVRVERDDDHVLLKKPSHPITIRNVLSHTSGLPFRSPLEEPTLDSLRLRDAVRSYAMLPLDFQPDQGYQYSNAGINTAARILEVVSGMPYEAFMQERLFSPLGMTDTTFWLTEDQIARLAKTYRPNEAKTDLVEAPLGQLTSPLNDRARQPMPAGGLFSSASDVARFCQMILNGGELEGRRYLSSEAVQEMTRRQTDESLPQSYGLGWSTGGGSFGHGGAHATNMTIDSAKGLILVWMVQHAGFPKNGNESQNAFRNRAYELYGK